MRRYTDLSNKPISPKARRMERHVPELLIILTRRCTDFFDKAELSKGGFGWNVTFPIGIFRKKTASVGEM